MEGFVVSARKYRPDTFDSVVGQTHVTNTLKNAIVANQLAHAFLFSGPRGVGKTTCARILAKAINCTNLGEDGEPCNNCDSCHSFNQGRSLNIHELDAASNNSVEDIRKIIEQVRYVPTSGKKSVFIIDEVHMLSSAAFNAFLKTLEEPPPHAIFILATTEKHKILPTILSRVQKFDFRRIKVNDVADHLQRICEKEGIEFEYEALQLIGLKADGALRDGLSIFDQIVSYSNKHITYDVVLENLQVLDYDYFFRTVDLMLAHDHEGLLLLLHEVVERGFEAKSFLMGLTEHFRNLLVARTPKTIGLLETSNNVKQRYLEQVKAITPTLLLNSFNLASQAEQGMRSVANPRLHIELALVKLAHLGSAIALAGTEKKKVAETQNEKLEGKPSVTAAVPKAASAEPKKATDPPKKKSKLRRSKSMKGSFRIPKSLDDVDLSKVGGGADEEDKEELIAFDENFQIDPEVFAMAFADLQGMLESRKNYMILSLLRKDAYQVKGNRWTQTVPNFVAKKQLFEEKSVLEFMRFQLKVPHLMLDIEVEEMAPETGSDRPLTEEAKLKLMLEKNPDLKELMQKFDTMMKY